MRFRLTVLTMALLLAPHAVKADYLDVITAELGDCSLEKYLKNVEEFRGLMKSQNYTYRVEIAVPMINDEMGHVYWLGRTADFATFAKEYSRWEAQVAKGGTPEAKMDAKFDACGENVSRSGHMLE